MIDKEFLEEYSLFRKFLLTKTPVDDVRMWMQKTPINMYCKVCNSNQTFNMNNEYYHDLGTNNYFASNRIFDIKYICQACKSSERRFLVYMNEARNQIYKVGQYPEWEIKMDKALEQTLNKHATNFRKGLVCEAQGYGIGAFSYYRRITEEIIDELLNSISDLIDEGHKEEYLVALEKTKSTRVTQEKIDLVKDLLPSILKPNGMNPLGVLHSELSEGLHAATDEACLENASHVKSILIFLVNQIIQSKESAKTFSQSMKSLLEKKSGK